MPKTITDEEIESAYEARNTEPELVEGLANIDQDEALRDYRHKTDPYTRFVDGQPQ